MNRLKALWSLQSYYTTIIIQTTNAVCSRRSINKPVETTETWTGVDEVTGMWFCWCWSSRIHYTQHGAITSSSNETRDTTVPRNSPSGVVYLLNARRILTFVDRFKNRPVSAPPAPPEFANIILQDSGRASRGSDQTYVSTLLCFGPSFCEVLLIDSHSVDGGARGNYRRARRRPVRRCPGHGRPSAR